MNGILSNEQVDRLLASQKLGRIGCYADEMVYVVPVSYAYHHGAIYSHSAEGQKTHMMRQNPALCFEVDQVIDPFNWSSAMVWGTYEELRYPTAQAEAKQILEHSLGIYANNEAVTTPPVAFPERPDADEVPAKTVYFCIKISKKSGRFEKHPKHPLS